MWNEIEFANPEFFWLFLIIPLLVVWHYFFTEKRKTSIKLSDTSTVRKFKNWKVKLRELPFILRLLTLSLVIVIIARPQTTTGEQKVTTEGIDIVMALDVSTSMLAEDLKPNRIKAAKNTAMEFIEKRTNDRLGLVVFAGQSFTQCPVTIDHNVLKELLTEIKTGMIEDGTAIGMGIATAVSRLKESKAKSRVIILLTDGDNNAGSIAPETAADIANTYNIRIYTIGVGSKGKAPYPVKTRFGTRYQNIDVKINEELLQNIADKTGGTYFRATNTEGLEEIYDKIDELEKTKVDVAYFSNYTEEYYPLAFAAIILLFLELILRFTIFRKLP